MYELTSQALLNIVYLFSPEALGTVLFRPEGLVHVRQWLEGSQPLSWPEQFALWFA